MKEKEYILLNTWLDKVKYLFTHDSNLSEIPDKELISLKELATLIKNAYSRFKEEYETLEKLDIGKNNNVLDFYKDECGRLLYMQINEQEEKTIVPKGFHYLILKNFDGGYNLSFTNTEILSYDRKVITINNLDSRLLNGYLDLFERYYPIFKLYVDLHENDSLTSNRSHYLKMRMDTTNDSLINGLNGVEFNIQNFSEMGNNFIIKLYIDLRNGITIDYNKSKIIVNDSVKNAKGFGYTEILNNVFENIRFNRSSLEDSQFIEYAENQKKLEKQKILIK